MWRLVAPAFADDFKVVLFDHVGAGQSDLNAYDVDKYSTLSGYAEDAFEKNLPDEVKFNFLAKPFTLKHLVAAVKETMAA